MRAYDIVTSRVRSPLAGRLPVPCYKSDTGHAYPRVLPTPAPGNTPLPLGSAAVDGIDFTTAFRTNVEADR